MIRCLTSFEAGYTGRKWGSRAQPSDQFYIDAQVWRDVGSVREECIQAAAEIADAYHGEELLVLYSGGRDSDFVLEAFRLAGARVRAIMVRAASGMNDEELRHASEFEVRTGFDKFDLVEVDHVAWLQSDEYRGLLRAVQCPFSSFLWYWGGLLGMKDLRDRPVIAGPMEPAFGLMKGVWALAMPEFELSIFKLFDHLGQRGVPSFFCWSGELWNSFLLAPAYAECLANKRKGIAHTNSLKGELLASEFGHRQRQKDILHTRPEFWVDEDSPCTELFCRPVNQWLGERGLR